MARFFVGQRVRLVHSSGENLGAEGTIREIGAINGGEEIPGCGGYCLKEGAFADCVVEWDRALKHRTGHVLRVGPCTLDRLEPIIPNGGASDWTFHKLMDRLRSGVAA